MSDKTIMDLIENEIRIEGIYPVKATMFFEQVFDSMYSFHSAIIDGDLDDILQFPEGYEEEWKMAAYIEECIDPNLLIAKISTPVKTGNSYSWGYTEQHWVKGYSLQELYNNAWDIINTPKEANNE